MPRFPLDGNVSSAGGKARQRQILIDKHVWRVHVATGAPDVVLGSLVALLEETDTDDIETVADEWLRRTYGRGTARHPRPEA